jgi:hypothetical protein
LSSGKPIAFSNDIAWGDSLLGRLINSVIRKAKIGINLVRIKNVIRQLEGNFERIVADSAILAAGEETQKEVTRLVISSLIGTLNDAVEKGEKVKTIISIVDSTIESVKSADLEEDKKKNLIEQLEEFKKFLSQFDPEDGVDSESDEDEDENDKDENGENDEKESLTYDSPNSYVIMIKNLKSLSLILANYKSVKIVGSAVNKEQTSQNVEKIKYTTVAGDTVEKIQKNLKANPKKLAAADIRTKNPKVLTKYPKDNQTMPAGLVLIMERYSLMEAKDPSPVVKNSFSTGGSADRGNIKSGEDHLTQAFTKIKKDIEVLISPKEKGIGVDVNFINDITSKSLDSKNKEIIKSFYKEINRYLVGDKKSTIQEKDALYKESIEVITDKNKRVIVAEKIARFTKRAIQFDGENLYGGLGNLSKPLEDFVVGIKQIMKMTEGKKEEPKKDSDDKKQESAQSNLLKYNRFLLIREADEKNEETEASDPKTQKTSDKIKDYFGKKFNLKEWVIEKTEVKKVENNIKNIKQDSVTLDSIDPIIEIVKLFNRAYKIHTVNVIPGGRSGGKVSRSVFNEYTPLGGSGGYGGGGDLSAVSQGPYRNNAIFDQWESAVQDIMKNRKYEPIFHKDTMIRVGDKEKKGAGTILRQFMTDLLDGDKLYKGDSSDKGGAQKKMLDKYFGEVVGPLEEGDLSVSNPDGSLDQQTNAENRDKMTENKLLFKTIDDLKDDETFKKFMSLNQPRVFLSCVGEENGRRITKYFYVQLIEGDQLYIAYCTSFFYFKQYVARLGGLAEINKGKMDSVNISPSGTEGAYIVRATKMKKTDFTEFLRKKTIELKSIDTNGKKKETEFKPLAFFMLSKENDGKSKLFSVPKDSVNALSGVMSQQGKGFASIKSVVDTGVKEGDKKFDPISVLKR